MLICFSIIRLWFNSGKLLSLYKPEELIKYTKTVNYIESISVVFTLIMKTYRKPVKHLLTY